MVIAPTQKLKYKSQSFQKDNGNKRTDRRYRCSWLRGTVVERRSLAGELSLSCARPVANKWQLLCG